MEAVCAGDGINRRHASESHRDRAGDDFGETAVTITLVDETAAARPAASAKGTVRPPAMPITTSRTVSVAVKCFSTWGLAGMTGISFSQHHSLLSVLPGLTWVKPS
jgi:hypothetical protein